MKSHFAFLDNYPILSNEKQKILFAEYKAGNKASKDKLINHNLRIALALAKQHNRYFPQFSIEDLFSVGCISIIRALEIYDPKHNISFGSYASMYAKGEITNYVRKNRHYGLTGTDTKPARKLRYKTKEIAKISDTRDPDEKELLINDLASKSKETPEAIKEYIDQSRIETNSMDSGIMTDSRKTLHDILGNNNETDVIDAIYLKEMRKVFDERAKLLSEREKDILFRVFECKKIDKKSSGFAEVAREANISRERVRQLYNSSLTKLGNNELKA